MKFRGNNLFNYATSELTQDAFICWLLSHLTEECYNFDINIRECARKFIEKVFDKKHIKLDHDFKINTIKRQYRKIDILVEIQDYKIIIEDKTFTSSHDNQINRYKGILMEEGVPEEKIICVFYKIIEQSRKENVDFEYNREILLEILSEFKDKISNQIFVDYFEYLKFIDYEVDSFKNEKIEKWTYKSNIGFFEHLRNGILAREYVDWSYVANPRGGFMALWIYNILNSDELVKAGFDKSTIGEVYLQIENNDERNIIAVKYSLNDDEDREMEYFTYREMVLENKVKIMQYFNDKIGSQFYKSKNVFGKSMTVGYIYYNECDYEEKIFLMKELLKNIKI